MKKTIKHNRGGIWNRGASIRTSAQDIADREVPDDAYEVIDQGSDGGVRTSEATPAQTKTRPAKKKSTKKKPVK